MLLKSIFTSPSRAPEPFLKTSTLGVLLFGPLIVAWKTDSGSEAEAEAAVEMGEPRVRSEALMEARGT